MERWVGRVALVTGSSAGIGEAISKILVKNGMKVVGCARRLDRLETLAKDLNKGERLFYPYKCDLSVESDIRGMFDWIENHPDLGRIDVGVANAGIGNRHGLIDGEYTEWKHMFDVNLLSMCLCTQLSLKSMLKHKIDDGQIVVTNSLGGHRLISGSPMNRMYSATKHGVTMLLEGFRQEIREQGQTHIRIGAISPGVVDTEYNAARFRNKPEDMPKTTVETEKKMTELTAENMAELVRYIIALPRHVQIHDIFVRPVEQKS